MATGDTSIPPHVLGPAHQVECGGGPSTTLTLVGGTVKVLGVVRHVEADGTIVDIRSAGQRRLLSALAASGSGTVRSEALCEMLDLGSSALRTSMSRLRSRVGDGVIDTDAAGYRLNVPVDADEFERLATTNGTLAERLTNLETALGLWDGDAFEEFSHEPWAEATAARLNELRLVAIEDHAELLVAARRSGEAVAALESHVAQNPLRDRAPRTACPSARRRRPPSRRTARVPGLSVISC